jgi:dienelactone hydrolase
MQSCHHHSSPGRVLAALVPLVALVLACGAPARNSPAPVVAPEGLWEGNFVIGGHRHAMRLELTTESTRLSAFLDVPDQYATRYTISDLAVSGNELSFAFPAVLPPARFVGLIERGRIVGSVTAPVDRDSARGSFELWRRPSAKPPYRTVDVSFRNGDVPLRGTLYLPANALPAPAVVFLHGSGPQTRESYLRFFADHFARHGIASLVYDKRNTGRTDIPLWQQGGGTFDELAADAAAAARILSARPEIDSSRSGYWGLSQGAWLAPIAARRAGRAAFLVLISGGGVTPAEQELYDDEFKLRELGYPQPVIDSALALLRDADQYVRTGADAEWIRLQAHLAVVRSRPWFPQLDRFPLILPREAGAWSGLRPDLDYDPRPALRANAVPSLVLLGERDPLTPTTETARRIEAAAREAGNGGVRIHVIQGADHGLFVPSGIRTRWFEQSPATGWVDEMTAWIRQVTASAAPSRARSESTPRCRGCAAGKQSGLSYGCSSRPRSPRWSCRSP